jgi:hypothetical protein
MGGDGRHATPGSRAMPDDTAECVAVVVEGAARA